jgi:hypothetical protein
MPLFSSRLGTEQRKARPANELSVPTRSRKATSRNELPGRAAADVPYQNRPPQGFTYVASERSKVIFPASGAASPMITIPGTSDHHHLECAISAIFSPASELLRENVETVLRYARKAREHSARWPTMLSGSEASPKVRHLDQARKGPDGAKRACAAGGAQEISTRLRVGGATAASCRTSR